MNAAGRMIVVLSLIAVISGGSLAVVDNLTRHRIEFNKKRAFNEGMKRLFPTATRFDLFKETENKRGEKVKIYKGMKGDAVAGWGLYLSGKGYQARIVALAAADRNLTRLLGVEILEQTETPGLGDNMTKRVFLDQFRGLSIRREIGFVKNQQPPPGSNNIQALSAATISTKAVLRIINENVKMIRDIEEIKEIIAGAR